MRTKEALKASRSAPTSGVDADRRTVELAAAVADHELRLEKVERAIGAVEQGRPRENGT